MLRDALTVAVLALIFSCKYPDKYNPLLEPRGPDICGLEIILPVSRIYENETTLAQAMAILSSGKKTPLAAGEVVWDSLNTDVALVDADGTVRGLSTGTGEIRIRMGDLTAEHEIVVERLIDYSRIKLSEVFYDPAGSDDGREFIEIYNDNEYGCDISGMQITDGSPASTPFVFPAGSSINAKSYAVVAQSKDGFFNLFGQQPDYSGFTFALNNNGETIWFIKQDGSPVDAVYIKGGSLEYPAPESWGSVTFPSAQTGNSVQRIIGSNTDSFSDWASGPPSPWR